MQTLISHYQRLTRFTAFIHYIIFGPYQPVANAVGCSPSLTIIDLVSPSITVGSSPVNPDLLIVPYHDQDLKPNNQPSLTEHPKLLTLITITNIY